MPVQVRDRDERDAAAPGPDTGEAPADPYVRARAVADLLARVAVRVAQEKRRARIGAAATDISTGVGQPTAITGGAEGVVDEE